ncbi:MAG: feruloyl-CoA synthase [Desulfuromonadaceae bacterium]|nr:feruloyl-CoA synthase [Desulfuromonadaceae bacterium]
MQHAEFAPIDFAPASVNVEETSDGGFLLTSPMPLEEYESSLGMLLRRWAKEAPERTFLGERELSGQWRLLTYSETAGLADSIAQGLIDRKLGPERPVMILSGNSINHALLMLGSFIAGVPMAPVSVAYSLLSDDFRKLKAIFSEVKPALVYTESGMMFSRALNALDLSGVEVVIKDGEVDGVSTTPFASLLETPATNEVEDAFAKVDSGTIAKLLFSSGSTGQPKGILNTHGMLCANQQMLAQLWPFTKETPPILVDWLPWNHTFGGNHNFNLVLKSGGTLYIDEGKPVPGLVLKSVNNLAEISPTIYFNVPAGFAMLLPHLERDEALRSSFFKKLQLIFYAGAALPQDMWQRLEAVSILATGHKVQMTSSWGSTETSPLATSAHFPIDRAGVIGLPCPGVCIKMVPIGEKYELRVKGPNVTPGYLNRPDLTRDAFDADGFYKIGDAGIFADPACPSRGITFAGRIAEDFKLTTGTWVHVGKTRLEVLTSAAPAVQDAIVAGHDREYIGILAWPNIAGCREICRDTEAVMTTGELVRSKEVVEHLRLAITKYNGTHMGSATRIRRIMLMTEPPSIDANEITDKGYINQRAALERRENLVEQLYETKPGPEVIVV